MSWELWREGRRVERKGDEGGPEDEMGEEREMERVEGREGRR